MSFTLVALLLAVAEAVFALVRIAPDSEFERPMWHTAVGTAALLLGVAWLLRRRTGIATAVLVVASTSVEQALDSAWRANASLAQLADPGAGFEPAFWLSALPVLARATIPIVIVALFATAPERRHGRWLTTATWLLVAGTVAAPIARIAFEASIWPPDGNDPWWYSGGPFMARFDSLTPLLLVATLAVIGSLRAEAGRFDPDQGSVAVPPRTGFDPGRSIVVALGLALVVWLGSAITFVARPEVAQDVYEVDAWIRLLWLPVLLGLIAFVVSRWSRTGAWLAIAGAFQTSALLVIYRAIAEYIVLVPVDAPDTIVPLTPLIGAILAAGVAVQVLAFGAMGVALRAATSDGPPAKAAEWRWAIGGAAVGVAIDAWYVGSAFVASGFPWAVEVTLLPAYPLAACVVAFGLWRRLVPAVAEAEAVAVLSVHPLRYLETVVAELVSGGAEHRRRAIEAERSRLAAELHDLRSTIGGLLSDRGLVLEPAPAGGARWPGRSRSDLRRPSDREIDVIALVATGASNEQIATELVLSLKTVESHLRRLFSRYDLTNRTELAVLAVREGWIVPR
jgi:DNA-binding CsgD family transcriptional regulator